MARVERRCRPRTAFLVDHPEPYVFARLTISTDSDWSSEGAGGSKERELRIGARALDLVGVEHAHHEGRTKK